MSAYAVEFVRGLQEGEDPRYMKVSACCKHYSAYDLEKWHGVERFEFDAIVNDRDMMDTLAARSGLSIVDSKCLSSSA